jgi:hypothetical protein
MSESGLKVATVVLLLILGFILLLPGLCWLSAEIGRRTTPPAPTTRPTANPASSAPGNNPPPGTEGREDRTLVR